MYGSPKCIEPVAEPEFQFRGEDQKTIIKKKNLKILIDITNKIINNNNCHKKYIKI